MERDRCRIGAVRSSARGGEGREKGWLKSRGEEGRVEMGMAKIGSCGSRSAPCDNGEGVRGENWQFLSSTSD